MIAGCRAPEKVKQRARPKLPTTTRFDSSTYSIADHEEDDGEDNDDLHDEQFQDEVLSPPHISLLLNDISVSHGCFPALGQTVVFALSIRPYHSFLSRKEVLGKVKVLSII